MQDTKNWIKTTEYSKQDTSLRYRMYFIRYMFTRPENFQTKNLFIQRENIYTFHHVFPEVYIYNVVIFFFKLLSIYIE